MSQIDRVIYGGTYFLVVVVVGFGSTVDRGGCELWEVTSLQGRQTSRSSHKSGRTQILQLNPGKRSWSLDACFDLPVTSQFI